MQATLRRACCLFAQHSGVLDHQYLVARVTNFLVVDIIKLVENNNGANDQRNGNEELKNNQPASQPAVFKTFRNTAL